MKKMLAMFAITAAACTQPIEEEGVVEVVIDSAYVDPATIGTTTDLEDSVVVKSEAVAE